MSMYLWLTGTALIFTAFGYWACRKQIVTATVQHTIDELIEGGYLRTAIVDGEEVLLPWDSKQ